MSKQEFDITFFADVVAKPVEWLWYPYIPYGKITLLQGDPGEGKTSFVLDLLSRLSNNDYLPCSCTRASNISIYQNNEDDISDTIKPRLERSGAQCDRICFIENTEQHLALDDTFIEDAIISCKARVIVLDPIQSFLGANCDINRASAIRPKMTKLKEVAARTGCAIILVGHLNKNSNGKSKYRGLGSIDISAAARSILFIGKAPSDPTRRAFAQLKNNLAPLGDTLCFSLDDGVLDWHGSIDLTADELMSVTKDKSPEIKSAIAFLQDKLNNGLYRSNELLEEAESTGISLRSLYAAKAQLPIRSVKRGKIWYWEIV